MPVRITRPTCTTAGVIDRRLTALLNADARCSVACTPPSTSADQISSWLSRGSFGGAGARTCKTAQRGWPVVLQSVQGLGGDFAEEPVFRCEPVTQAMVTFPGASRPGPL